MARHGTKLYGLFYRARGERRWTRFLPEISLPKEALLKAFQGWLIFGYGMEDAERTVRPIKEAK